MHQCVEPVELGGAGINSFKMFMAYKDVFMLGDTQLFLAFERIRDLGAIAMVYIVGRCPKTN